jgi:putative transposase/transposase-like zinc-binding protein
MKAPAPDLADIFRVHGPAYLAAFGDSLSGQQKRALREISLCRTAALGGHVEQCDHCGHRKISYCSCRNRHCPKCQAAARAAWLEQRAAELLPVEYFHVVFTLPQPLAPLALQNQRVLYGILFRAASETLLQIGADPKHLGARIGFLAVLHTWGQNLHHHPHLHCVVPGGGIAPDGCRWTACRRQFLFPVKVLSRLFRAKFASYLKRAFHHGKLRFHGKLEPLGKKTNFFTWLDKAARSEWVVYAKPPFGGPQQVLKYLARYTHRAAISNQRLVALHDGLVTFRWKDYAQASRPAIMTLQATEFIRRFLLHVLPTGFVKIRHFGFLANRCRKQKILLCRKLLDIGPTTKPERSNAQDPSLTKQQEPKQVDPCPVCKVGFFRAVEILLPQASTIARLGPRSAVAVPETDTS